MFKDMLIAEELITEASTDVSPDQIIANVAKKTGKSKEALKALWEKAAQMALRVFKHETAPGYQANLISHFIMMAL
jgi:hypothetical protein